MFATPGKYGINSTGLLPVTVPQWKARYFIAGQKRKPGMPLPDEIFADTSQVAKLPEVPKDARWVMQKTFPSPIMIIDGGKFYTWIFSR